MLRARRCKNAPKQSEESAKITKKRQATDSSHIQKTTKLSNKQKTDDSYDEMYQNYKQRQKENVKSRLRPKALAAVKLKSSTPTQIRNIRGKNKQLTSSSKNKFFLEISPIRRSASNTNVTHVDHHSTKTPMATTKKASDYEIDDSLVLQESNEESSDICALKNLIDELKLKREMSALNGTDTKNSSEINLVLQQIENIYKKDTPEKKKPLPKKSVHFNAACEEGSIIKLKPGKWRKSLMAWRKSHNPKRKSTRKFSGLFPIKTDPNLIKRFTEKLHETLSNSSLLLEKSDEGQLQSALSILDSSASFHEPATFAQHPLRKISKRETSVFQRSSIFYGLKSPLIHEIDVVSNLSARQILLRRCGQQEPLPFDEIYAQSELPNCKKIGEGAYGEVFCYASDNGPIVLKIIPIEGEQLVNEEQQKRFDEILSEVVISMELSDLRNGSENVTDGFVNVKRVTCVKGVYPQHLIDEWDIFNDSYLKRSENENPEIFGEDQLYIVFELCNAGIDLEAFQFKHAEEAFSVFIQVALTLAVAENKFLFEHRDLHWGNILVARTLSKFAEYRVDGRVIRVPTHGVKATIIDYTLSRMVYDGAVLYNNLAEDEDLFGAEGDYQFDIYRLMRDRLDNEFKRFEPYTNLLWLHYLLDKLIDGARYKYSKSDKHKAAVDKMMKLRDDLLVDYQSASEYVEKLEIANDF